MPRVGEVEGILVLPLNPIDLQGELNKLPSDQVRAEIEGTILPGERVNGGDPRARRIEAETDANGHLVHGSERAEETGIAVGILGEFEDQGLRGAFGSSKNKIRR